MQILNLFIFSVAAYNTTTKGPCLLAVSTKQQHPSYAIFQAKDKLIQVNTQMSKNWLFMGCNIQQSSTLRLKWLEGQSESSESEIALYSISNRLDGLSVSLGHDELVRPRNNQSWTLVTNWRSTGSLDFLQMDTKCDIATGKFTANQNGEYLVTAVVNFRADMQRLRFVLFAAFSQNSHLPSHWSISNITQFKNCQTKMLSNIECNFYFQSILLDTFLDPLFYIVLGSLFYLVLGPLLYMVLDSLFYVIIVK